MQLSRRFLDHLEAPKGAFGTRALSVFRNWFGLGLCGFVSALRILRQIHFCPVLFAGCEGRVKLQPNW